MTDNNVYVLTEIDFGHQVIVGVFSSVLEAKKEKESQEKSNSKSWITYEIEVWEVL